MKLQIVKGPEAGRSFVLPNDGEFVLGRDPLCDARIDDPELSRRHARLVGDGARILLEDMDSTNGTAVNGQTVLQRALTDGDEILLGTTVLTVQEVPTPEPLAGTTLRLRDVESDVLVSLHHTEADLLAGESTTDSAEDIVHENRVLRHICGISQEVASGRGTDHVLTTVLDRLKSVLNADTCCLLLRAEGEDGDPAIRATSSDVMANDVLVVSGTIMRRALSDGEAILTANPLDDRRFSSSDSIVHQGIRSAMYCPFKTGTELNGVIAIDRRRSGGAFTALDLRLAGTAASLIGVFLEKDRLQAEHQNQARLAVIGEVVAGLAHYAKNIITGLRFSMGSLKAVIRTGQTDKAEHCLESMASHERRISNLIMDMLSYAKNREPERSDVDLRALIEEVMEPYGSRLEELGIAFEVASAAGSSQVQADESALHRVFLNLLLNAVDALESRKDDADKMITVTIGGNTEPGHTEIRLRDTGCGVPADKLQNIFAVFYSTKGSRGTGLGLAVVHKIIEEHGGQITVDSEEGAWTEFRITLPTAVNSTGTTKTGK